MWVTYHILYHAGIEDQKIYHWMLRSEYFAKLKYQILQMEGNVSIETLDPYWTDT